ncbi:MAG TPA: hypothetical protein VFK90_08465 [Anaeromyxobacter sp.]|nr:hypothetical protein [Anaeromyxobacter sp.]
MDESTTVARRGGGMKSAIAWLAILGLLALVVWLAAERNARTWHLVPDEGRLVVMKGMMLPAGRSTFQTSDPALAQAYAPLVAPPGKPLPAERSFEERALLDQALYDVLAGWAKEEIASGDPARLERGLGYLGRAEKLPGLSPSQRDDLSALRAESGFQEGLRLLARAAEELRDAAEKLRRAATSRSTHASDAGVLLKDVEPAVEAATGALRQAARFVAKPAPAPEAAAAVPQQPQQAAEQK